MKGSEVSPYGNILSVWSGLESELSSRWLSIAVVIHSMSFIAVVRPNESSEMTVSEVSPYRNMRCKKGNEGQGRGATTDTIRHVRNRWSRRRLQRSNPILEMRMPTSRESLFPLAPTTNGLDIRQIFAILSTPAVDRDGT